MSDYFGGDSFAQVPVANVWQDLEPAKGAPFFILVAGTAATLAAFAGSLVFSPAGSLALAGHVALWFLSLAVFLLPIALFTVEDLKRQLVIGYPTHPKVVRTAKFTFLVLGLLASLFQVYELATTLSKILNVG